MQNKCVSLKIQAFLIEYVNYMYNENTLLLQELKYYKKERNKYIE